MHCTYYTHSRLPLADGSSYHQRGLFAASNDWPLGTKLRITSKRTGRSVVVTVRDRSARWVHHPDLCSRAAARIEPRYRIVGHIPVSIEVIRRPRHSQRYTHAHKRTSHGRHGLS
jgi:rare lipoprotein A (peptidoglycan hydrolase)